MTWNLINVTCQVKKFYPSVDVMRERKYVPDRSGFYIQVNKGGTYSGTSWLLVNQYAYEEGMVLTCLVEHDRQSPVVKSHTLVVVAYHKDQDISTI
ncbi:hypothetical protein A6R68_03979, partial [Neotoma lepida]